MYVGFVGGKVYFKKVVEKEEVGSVVGNGFLVGFFVYFDGLGS